MRSWTFILIIFVAGAGLYACAQTSISSFTDPNYVNRAQYTSVMVAGQNLTINELQIAEQAMVEAFADTGVRVERGTVIIPPTRNYTAEESADRIIDSNVQAILFIRGGGKDVSRTYVPQTTTGQETRTTVQQFGDTTRVNTYTTPGYTSGGYTIEKPIGSYSAVLIDVNSADTVWQADMVSEGSGFDTFDTLMKSAATKTVTKLISDGLF